MIWRAERPRCICQLSPSWTASLAIEPELLARIRAASDAYDFDRAGSYISDDLLRRVAFAGTPEQVADQAAAVFEAGARRVEFGTFHGLTTAEGLRLLGERVLPALLHDSRGKI